MSVEVGTILWAKNRPSDHDNHLHVEPPVWMAGTPPTTNPGMTAGIEKIYDALVARFGPGAYFTMATSATKWTHMGGWNRRTIAGSTTWSQHAWWNALDIGPYYGIADQQRFYDFLTGAEEEDMAEGYLPLHLNDGTAGQRPYKASDVAWMQARLNRAFGTALRTDGNYGPATAAVIAQYIPDATADGEGTPGRAFTGNRADDLDWALAVRAAVSIGGSVPSHTHPPHRHPITGQSGLGG